ncbi:MAG: hydantoinase/oxoprolinase family protein [Alphaproteobacteria bacterium]|nr:hydantoinase/oxoprolinase family protein [Alphaproteobacteria bacterium]
MTGTGGWRVGADIGGTFTDVVAVAPERGLMRVAKVPSRPEDPLAGLVAALAAVELEWAQVDDLVHGTTLVTNAIVEDKLARVALVTTEGFADTLAIARQNRRHLYRLDLKPKLEPQVAEALRLEVAERVGPDGAVLVALEPAAAEAVARAVEQSGAEAVAVCLIHAYANPSHEETLGARLRGVIRHVSLSHRVNPEAREYERSVATVLNAGVMPLVAGYLERLEAENTEGARVHFFHSAGGMTPPSALAERPLALALSGPAAGVAAAARVSAKLGLEEVISFDMGGTTTDVCLIISGRAEVHSNRLLAERPLRQLMVAVETIGAGGGSLARAEGGAMRVGPESAGADPGPACYAQGGVLPTVTDANLVLGYLSDKRLLGGEIRLELEAARQALAPLARELEVTTPELALGIHQVANANMTRALRRVTVERGVDARRCTLLAFGGAGPLHAAGLAAEFGIARVIVPALSSVFSAFGCLAAEPSYAQQQTLRMASAAWDGARIEAVRTSLIGQISPPLREAGHERDLVLDEVAQVRYAGQSYAIDVPYAWPLDPAVLGRDFRRIHHQLYGFASDEPWELQGLRLRLSAPTELTFDGLAAERGGAAAATAEATTEATTEAPCWFEAGAAVATPRYDRGGLAPGWQTLGPAIVEDDWSTVLVPPGTRASVDEAVHLLLELGAQP